MNFGDGEKRRVSCSLCLLPLDLQILHLLGSILGASLRLLLGLLLRGGALGKLLDVRKELGRAGNVLAQHLGDFDTLFFDNRLAHKVKQIGLPCRGEG